MRTAYSPHRGARHGPGRCVERLKLSTGGPAAPGPEREREDCSPAALPAARAAPSESGRGTLGCYLQASGWVVFSTGVHRPDRRCPPPRPRGASGTRAWARAGAGRPLPRPPRRGLRRPQAGCSPTAPPPARPSPLTSPSAPQTRASRVPRRVRTEQGGTAGPESRS